MRYFLRNTVEPEAAPQVQDHVLGQRGGPRPDPDPRHRPDGRREGRRAGLPRQRRRRAGRRAAHGGRAGRLHPGARAAAHDRSDDPRLGSARRAPQQEQGAHQVPRRQARHRRVPPAVRSGTGDAAARGLGQQYREPDFTLLEEAPASGSYASRNGGPAKQREGFEVWRRTNALKQSQAPGTTRRTCCCRSATSTAEQMHALAEIARKYAGGHIRTAASQNFVLRWVHEDDLAAVHGELVDIGLAEDHAMTISDVMTCPGADTCAIGVTSSKGLGTELRSRIIAGNGTYHNDPLVNEIKIKISGCPNSCGQHHVADIGFYGMAIRVGERQIPAFQLMLGGNAQGEGKLAKLTMKIPARDAPDAGREAARHVRRRAHGRREVRRVDSARRHAARAGSCWRSTRSCRSSRRTRWRTSTGARASSSRWTTWAKASARSSGQLSASQLVRRRGRRLASRSACSVAACMNRRGR